MIEEVKILLGLAASKIVNPFYKTQGAKAVAREIDTFFIAYSVDAQVLGVVRYCLENNTPMLRSMQVHSEFQRQKVGQKLLDAFNHFLNENGTRHTYCIPYTHLERFYGRIGFKKVQEASAPLFIQERLSEYRERQMSVICMRRD